MKLHPISAFLSQLPRSHLVLNFFFLRLTKDRYFSKSTDYNEHAKRLWLKSEIIEPTLHNILLEQILDLVVKKKKKKQESIYLV